MVMKPFRPSLFTVLVLLFLAGPTHAKTIYVNQNTTLGDGTSWGTPLASLSDALGQAVPGDQVWVAQGAYLPTKGTDRKGTFRLPDGVEVYGGFSGSETDPTKRDIKRNPTILSGDIGAPGVLEDNVYHVVTAKGKGVLDGFTISEGYSANVPWMNRDHLTPASVASGYHQGMGAGILIFKGAPAVRNCVIRDNHALIGGGVYVMSSTKDTPLSTAPDSPQFTDCVFWQNSALGHGGGAANLLRTAPLYVSCVFDSNVADIQGGGMFNDFGAAPKLLNTLFRNNEAESGGGIANNGSAHPVLFYSTLTGNRAHQSGPAIHQSEGQPNTTMLLKSVVWDNACNCQDIRFFNGPPSEIRVRESVIQGGYQGKSVFQANPGLNRQSVTLLNSGYKTDGHRFRKDKLRHRLRDVGRFEKTGNLPEFDPTYVAVIDPRLLATVATPAPGPKAAPTTPPAPELKSDHVVPESPRPKAIASPKTPPSPAPASQPESAQAMRDMDFDGNGLLTINEARGPLQQHFWRVDINGDGFVSPAELKKFNAGRHKRTKTPPRTQHPVQAQTVHPAPRKTIQTASRPQAAPAIAKQPTPQAGGSTGYTLFAPINGRKTYLIDKDGNVSKEWANRERSSGAVYLLDNGNLLRSVSPDKNEVQSPFEGPDVNGGIIQEVSPRGQVVWEYVYANKDVRQHHDIEPLPNGNVLLLAWELKTGADIQTAGGAVRNHPDGHLWAEHIVEIRKSGPRSGVIAWEWHAWDHLVQDTDNNAPNYANPARLPQRIDLNYNPGRSADWHHANSIDYNPVVDQIVISLRNTNEIWIIDHSTSTAQAASNAGGIMHRGGDLLFRWGNPAAWGGTRKRALSGQHDATWITGSKPGDETILVFNNGSRRTGKSDIIEIKPAYYFKSTRLEADVVWSYTKQGGTPFFADHASGAQRLENGNTLVCDGVGVRLFEVTPDGKTVWQYLQPNGSTGDGLFRATRIKADHPGLKRLLR